MFPNQEADNEAALIFQIVVFAVVFVSVLVGLFVYRGIQRRKDEDNSR